MPENETQPVNPATPLAEITFLLLKPYTLYSGMQDEIVNLLQRNRFGVLSIRRLPMTKDIVRAMFKPWTDIVPDGIINSFLGPCVFIELTRENAISELRRLCGDDNPSVARIGTFHYMYGTNSRENGVFAPGNRDEFVHMFGVLEGWAAIYINALRAVEEPAVMASQDFMASMLPKKEPEGQETPQVESPEIQQVSQSEVPELEVE